MKKIIRFVLNSIILFWGYFISSTLSLMLIMVPMRIFVPADGFIEHLWKTVVLYLFMAGTCSVHLLATSPIHKVKYLRFLGENQWTFPSACKYTIQNPDFWYNAVGFCIWPVLIPKLFGVVCRFYFFYHPDVLEKIPASLLSLPFVDLPFFLLAFLMWVCILRHWSKNRIRVPGGKTQNG